MTLLALLAYFETRTVRLAVTADDSDLLRLRDNRNNVRSFEFAPCAGSAAGLDRRGLGRLFFEHWGKKLDWLFDLEHNFDFLRWTTVRPATTCRTLRFPHRSTRPTPSPTTSSPGPR